MRAGTAGTILCEITAFMRYAGQGWEIPVPLPDRPLTADDARLIRDRFRDTYARFFGRAIDGLDGLEIEIVTFSVKAAGRAPVPDTGHADPWAALRFCRGHPSAVFDPATGRTLTTGHRRPRVDCRPAPASAGPAVVVERETSTVVTSPFDVVMQADGSLLLIRKEVSK